MLKDITERLTRMDDLISKKATGTPPEFAKRLGISERNLYDMLKLMKTQGAPIAYDRNHSSYGYTSNGRFMFGFLHNF